MTKYLSKAFGKNIRVNCISPGGIKTNQPKSFQRNYRKSCLTKGLSNPKDICGAVEFLISDKSKHINVTKTLWQLMMVGVYRSNVGNKKILITGAAGFIGFCISLNILLKEDIKLSLFDRYNPNNSFGWLDKSPYKKKVECILGDIRDYDLERKAMKISDSVIHLAALNWYSIFIHFAISYIKKINVEGTCCIITS